MMLLFLRFEAGCKSVFCSGFQKYRKAILIFVWGLHLLFLLGS